MGSRTLELTQREHASKHSRFLNIQTATQKDWKAAIIYMISLLSRIEIGTNTPTASMRTGQTMKTGKYLQSRRLWHSASRNTLNLISEMESSKLPSCLVGIPVMGPSLESCLFA